MLASVGAVAVAGGSGLWATGESLSGGSHDSASHPMINAGFVTRRRRAGGDRRRGGWMASSVVCEADPDCPEEEQCREVPAPPGRNPLQAVHPALAVSREARDDGYSGFSGGCDRAAG
jgi:hypothetical protein